MKVLICGSRDYKNYNSIYEKLRILKENRKEIVVIEGGAKGADLLAKKAAEELEIEVHEYKANWSKYGKAAGPIRNQEMLEKENPDIVIAFHENIDSSKGTKDMIERTKKRKIQYEIVK